jgi:hypothetical protein
MRKDIVKMKTNAAIGVMKINLNSRTLESLTSMTRSGGKRKTKSESPRNYL